MHAALTAAASALAIRLALAAAPAVAQTSTSADAAKDQEQDEIYRGYFEDEQIEGRTLADWEGDWQSVYPYLVDGPSTAT